MCAASVTTHGGAMDVFVSHSSKDANFTHALVRLLRVALGLSAAQIRATSIEETQLRAGSDVDESLRAEVRDSRVFIAVLSPNSLASTYVLFELGARWGADKKMLPVLMPNMSSEQLDIPLNRLYARKSDRLGLLSLIEQIAETLSIRVRECGNDRTRNVRSTAAKVSLSRTIGIRGAFICSGREGEIRTSEGFPLREDPTSWATLEVGGASLMRLHLK